MKGNNAQCSGYWVPFRFHASLLLGLSTKNSNQATAKIKLALQLVFCFEVRALSGSLVSSTPE